MSDQEQRVRVGVVGLGYWGPNLARNLAAIAGCELAWLCDASPEARAKLERGVPGGARQRRDLDELLADELLDAVVLATPVPTHAELAVSGGRGRQALLRREAARDDRGRRRARRRGRRAGASAS